MMEDDISLSSTTVHDEEVNNKMSIVGEKVIEAVRKSPNLTIKPARLATILGISVDEASAELCGLLSAVGKEATFTFEQVNKENNQKDVTMVFQFPPNFEQKAKLYRRKQIFYEDCITFLSTSYEYLKVFIAFGLIFSLFILLVSALIFLIAAAVAMASQQRNRNENAFMWYKVRSMLMMLRELLWFYAIFGGMFEHNNGNDNNPFFRDIAMTVSSFISLFYGNIFHPSFWYRSRLLTRRRRRMQRGWGTYYYNDNNRLYSATQGTWGQEIREERNQRQQQTFNYDDSSFPGLVSIAAEFLFGPTPSFQQEPSDQDKWRMRALLIASKPSGIISIPELIPYVDYPPNISSIEHVSVSYGLGIVSHFNGKPVISSTNKETNNLEFQFPELASEAATGLPTPSKSILFEDDPDIAGTSILFNDRNNDYSLALQQPRNSIIPKYLREKKHVLTRLQKKHFLLCIALGLVNYIGIIMLKNALNDIFDVQGLLDFIMKLTISFLYFYSKLFLLLPICRLFVVILLNKFIERRNCLRREFAEKLKA